VNSLSRKSAFFFVLLVCTMLLFEAKLFAAEAAPVVMGYVYPEEHRIQKTEIDAHRLTRINYAFGDLKNGRMASAGAVESANLATLTALRSENPGLTVLISVGGWGRSAPFTAIARTAAARQAFLQSVLIFLDAHHLDGLDIDWEYPGQAASGHVSLQDKENFTLLLRDLREGFDRRSLVTHRKYLLTIAVGVNGEYLEHTEMDRVAVQVDAVNLMSYDLASPEGNEPTSHSAPLYTNPASPTKDSVDAAVKAFLKAGVPAEKLVVGVPFYGHAWSHVSEANHGLFHTGRASSLNFVLYETIANKLLKEGFARYWDSVASAPYLYNAQSRTFVSYDDPESLAAKCIYVREHKLGGVMFWQYSGDPSGELLRTLHAALYPATK